MPRIRTLKPEFATDEKLAKISRDARLTFVLAITQADDDGLLPGNHRQLLAALYPLDDSVTFVKLSAWLEELIALGRLRWRETRDGSPILEIVHWGDHQKVDHKGKSLILPQLKPCGEEEPRDSREAREGVANDSRSDLGPTTKDQGPTTSADAPAGSTRSAVHPDAEAVFAFYRTLHPTKRPEKRSSIKLITSRLASFTADELRAALRGNAGDTWAISSGNQGLAYVLKSNDAVDKWRALAAPRSPVLAVLPQSRGRVLLDLFRRYDLFAYNGNQDEYVAKRAKAAADPAAGPDFIAECSAVKPWREIPGDNDHFKAQEIEKRLAARGTTTTARAS